MHPITKQVNKFIKELSQKIPKSYYEGTGHLKKEVFDNRLRQAKFSAMEGQELQIINDEGNEIVLVKDTVLFQINHLRRLKKAYKATGYDGVQAYIKWVNSNNKMINEKYGMKYSMFIISEVMNRQISTFL